jgi:hypothetical protein
MAPACFGRFCQFLNMPYFPGGAIVIKKLTFPACFVKKRNQYQIAI